MVACLAAVSEVELPQLHQALHYPQQRLVVRVVLRLPSIVPPCQPPKTTCWKSMARMSRDDLLTGVKVVILRGEGGGNVEALERCKTLEQLDLVRA